MIAVACLASFTFVPATTPSLDDQAYFAILAETKVGRMAGMPKIDLGDLPPGIKLPPEAMMFAGVAARVLNIRLWSPTIAAANAEATVAPPAGLKQGDKLNLEIYRPTAADATAKVRDFDPDSNPDGFTIKIYWGSSETVKEGQPKIIKWSGISKDQQAAMRQRAREAQAANSYYYKDGWTTAYWPTKKQPGNIADDASLVGLFSLKTNYTGNVDIEAPSNVTFLGPYAISKPDLEKKMDLKKAINLEWTQIPNLLGQNAMAMGMEGKNTLILWSSSEVYDEGLMGDMGFLQMADVRDFVAKTVFMKGDTSKVSIPIGIFKDVDFAMLTMTGYGPGAALEKAQPLPRIQTKTSMMLMLGGKKANF